MPVFELSDRIAFPPVHLAGPEGLLAVGGDLSTKRLLRAYREGIFPWFSDDDPILWWSPDPRLVLFPDEFKVSKSLNKVLRKGGFKVTTDRAFDRVIDACARLQQPGQAGTWIGNDMIRAYNRLHDLGYAHSVETWHDGELSGGLYGVSLGNCFFGESMFTLVDNASKIALYTLVSDFKCLAHGLIDCQVKTTHLISLGAREIHRKEFMDLLDRAMKAKTRKGKWTIQANGRINKGE